MAFQAKKREEAVFTCKVELLVCALQGSHLDGQSKICSWARNYLIDEVNQRMRMLKGDAPLSEEEKARILKTIYTEGGIRDLLPLAKLEHPHLKLVYSSPLKNVGLNLAKGIKAHQAGRSEWIRRKKWKRHWTTLEYDEVGKGWKVLTFKSHKELRLSFGTLADGTRLQERIKLAPCGAPLHKAVAVRIVKDLGKYYAVFTFKKPKAKAKPLGEVPKLAYIDPNSSNFGYLVDTEGKSVEIEHMRERIKSLCKRLDYVQSLRDKCKSDAKVVEYTREDGSLHRHTEGSLKYKRLDKVMNRLYAMLREQKKQYMYALAHRLAATYDAVGIGNWVPDSTDHQQGSRFNRIFINMNLLGQFKTILKYVFEKSGKAAYVLDEKGTTRTCHKCGTVVSGGIPPGVKRWTCAGCGMVHIRDENAGLNGLRRLVEQLGFSHMPRSGHGIAVPCSWRFHPQVGWTEICATAPHLQW